SVLAKSDSKSPEYLKCVKENGDCLYQSSENSCNKCICTPSGKIACIEFDCKADGFKKDGNYKKCVDIFKAISPSQATSLCISCKCDNGGGIACKP
ncbi:hypothetical protein BB561_006991, partial [Smittium simulii]